MEMKRAISIFGQRNKTGNGQVVRAINFGLPCTLASSNNRGSCESNELIDSPMLFSHGKYHFQQAIQRSIITSNEKNAFTNIKFEQVYLNEARMVCPILAYQNWENGISIMNL